MILDTFFSISKITSDIEKTIIDVEINWEHVVFEGHFPGNPVAPGVFLIQMIRESIEIWQQKKFIIVQSDEMKFISIVSPQQNRKLSLEIKQKEKSEDTYKYNIILTDGNTVFFKMKVELEVV